MKMKRQRIVWLVGGVVGALAAMPGIAGDPARPMTGPRVTVPVDANTEPFPPKFELPHKHEEGDGDHDHGDQNSIEGDPLRDLAESLMGITEDLQALQTGLPVQQKQQGVIAALDKLIAQIEKQQSQCKSCSGSGSAASRNPSKPLAKSTIVGGPGGIGDLHAPRSGQKSLDSISPRLREQITQSQNEGFPPGYQQLLEQYYKRLAERRGEDSAAPATPAKPLTATP